MVIFGYDIFETITVDAMQIFGCAILEARAVGR